MGIIQALLYELVKTPDTRALTSPHYNSPHNPPLKELDYSSYKDRCSVPYSTGKVSVQYSTALPAWVFLTVLAGLGFRAGLRIVGLGFMSGLATCMA